MGNIFHILAQIVNVYMILIFIRIILSWFPGIHFGRLFEILCAVCDPFLNWFRRFRLFPNSPISFAPLLALGSLSIIQRALLTLGTRGRISVAGLLALILTALVSIITWILGFFIIILILRMIAFLFNSNIYSPFWRIIDFLSQPIMYRISRIFFPNRIINYLFRIIFSIFVLLALGVLIQLASRFGLILLMRLHI